MKAENTDLRAETSAPGRNLWRTLRIGILLAVAAFIIAASATIGASTFEGAVLVKMRQSSSFAIAGNATALETKLQKFRLVPLALSSDPELLHALEAPTEDLRQSLNERFEDISGASGAAAIYLIDKSGVTFAASNFRSDRSFVGQDYSFREYFQRAIEERAGEEFAIGTVSGEPGLYLSRSIAGDGGAARGVIVLKLRFDDIESYWREQNRLILATDADGRIIVASEAPLRFQTLEEGRSGVRKAPPKILESYLGDGPVLATIHTMSDGAWNVASFEPLKKALSPARISGALTGASVSALALAFLAFLIYRFDRAARKTREIAAYRARLEAAVEARTQELRSSYAQLTDETARRERAQESMRIMRDEIAQLNRLAILGQLSAKVAHEINQPLAALRNYVDSSIKMLKSGDEEMVSKNLETMSGLVMRAGKITGELRSFSRKRPTVTNEIEIGRAIDGALLIATPALNAGGVALRRDASADSVLVRVDQIRMEQVILNVVQNGIDALKNTPEPYISISSYLDDDQVVVKIEDNGPGVAEPEDLFTAFHSTKESGLGLGLSISRDILGEFGGDIRYDAGKDGGARFVIRLPRTLT